MPVQITILGLGPLGASIGLALAAAKGQITRVGSDISGDVMRLAQKNGAIDQTVYNLPDAVRQADGVVLCLPLDELRKTMEAIRLDLKPGVVVLDTSPAPRLSSAWATELFPAENCYFLSFTPAHSPAGLLEPQPAARADWFQNAAVYIAHSQGIDPSAIEFSDNFARLIGASPVFSDVNEVEGLLALGEWMPLLSAAALSAAARQPGWKEARRLAGAGFALSGQPLDACTHGAQPALGLVSSREDALRVVDLLSGELAELRELIAAGDEAALAARLEQSRAARAAWFSQRRQAKWEDEDDKRPPSPTFGDTLGRLIGLKPRSERPGRTARK